MAFESVEQLVEPRLSAPGGMQRKRLRESALPLIVLAIGLSATFVVNHQATARAERQASERFMERASEISNKIVIAFKAPVQSLGALVAVLETFPGCSCWRQRRSRFADGEPIVHAAPLGDRRSCRRPCL